MKAFEYASPETEQEAVELLAGPRGQVEVLAGGTDLVGLMKKMIVTPKRVVSLQRVESLKQIDGDSQGVRIGDGDTRRLARSSAVEGLSRIEQATRAIGSLQLQSQGTIGGELCQRPRCWYFRNARGLLAQGGNAAAEGDNRFHAIFGNSGAAKFVSPSRFAPALVRAGRSRADHWPGRGQRIGDAAGIFLPHSDQRARARA